MRSDWAIAVSVPYANHYGQLETKRNEIKIMIDIPSTVKAGITIYKIIELFLSDVYDELGKVYIDIADAHFMSAKQAFKALKNSKQPDSEVRAGINHLRDAYNIYYSLIRREKTERIFLFWKTTYRPGCNNSTTSLTVDIATIISLLYKDLGEIENSQDWKEMTLESFCYHEDNYYFNYDELVKIDSEFGSSRLKRRGGNGDGLEIEYIVTEKGKSYAKNRLSNRKRDLDILLSA